VEPAYCWGRDGGTEFSGICKWGKNINNDLRTKTAEKEEKSPFVQSKGRPVEH